MSLALARIWKAALLGLMTTTVITGGVAFSPPATGAVGRGPLFTAIDLTSKGVYAAFGISGGQLVGFGLVSGSPHAMLWRDAGASVVDLHPRSGFSNGANGSRAFGISGGQQVGWAYTVDLRVHALLWNGTASSVVDLHPSWLAESQAFATSGEQQVGRGSGPTTGTVRGFQASHALLWRGSAASVVDLHPSGFTYSEAVGVSGGQQVGDAHIIRPLESVALPRLSDIIHALLWRGSAASVVDLNPSGFTDSEAHGISGGEIVGWGDVIAPDDTGILHALLWHGTATNVVDLHPRGFDSSEANGTNGTEQVGWGLSCWSGGGELRACATAARHALLWYGSAATVVDLHAFLPSDFVQSEALGIDSSGVVLGYAKRWEDGTEDSHYFLWVPTKKPGRR